MAAWLFLLALLTSGLTFVGGVHMFNRRKASERDDDRVSYAVTFPHELEYDSVVAWLRAISRTTASARKNHRGAHSIGFEVEGHEGQITHRMLIPWQIADDVTGQLRALVPGVNVERQPRRVRQYKHAAEVGLKDKSLPLHIPEPGVLAASLLASLNPLAADESLLIQWVVVPAPREPLPVATATHSFGMTFRPDTDRINAQRNKLDDANFLGVVRVAAAAHTKVRAEHLVDRVRSSFRSTETPFNTWVRNVTSVGSVLQRVHAAASLTIWPAQVSVSELSAFIAWPVDSPHVSGLPQGAARHLPAPAVVPRDGLKLGASTFPGNERPVALGIDESAKHIWIVGPTGSGKSVLAAHLVKQMMDNGSGLMLIETKRDLFQKVMNEVPRERLNDVIVVDVEDTEKPVGFNLLEGSNPYQLIDDLEAIVSNIHGDDKNVWFKEVVYFGLRTLMARPGATVSDLPALLSPRFDEVQWRDQVIRDVTDPELSHFWQRLENQGAARRDQIVAPVLSRFWQFNRPQLRANFAQRTSSFTMQQVVDERKIVLVNLTGVDKTTTQILGSVMVNSLRHEIWRRGRLPVPFYLVADEAQNITHLPIGLNGLLDQARGFNFGLLMANQAAHQLPTHIRQAVQSNARTKVAFQMESDDAKLMAAQFGGGLTEHDFMNLRNYDAYARVAIEGGVSAPMSIHPPPPGKSRNNARSARLASQVNFGRALTGVEADIAAWRRVPEASKDGADVRRRPKLSGEDWT